MLKKVMAVGAMTVAATGISVAGASSAEAACQAKQAVSNTVDWSNNCTVSTTKNQTSDLTSAIQNWLWRKGYQPGERDGIFGSQTKEAVIKAQKRFWPDDRSQWDGVVGPKTWAKMDNSVYNLNTFDGYKVYGMYGVLVDYMLDTAGSNKGYWYTVQSTCAPQMDWAAMDSGRDCR